MKILVVFCHPRRASLTGAIADAFVEGASDAGHEIEFADLYGENFDPHLHEADEPDWDDQRKVYSPEVKAELRLNRPRLEPRLGLRRPQACAIAGADARSGRLGRGGL